MSSSLIKAIALGMCTLANVAAAGSVTAKVDTLFAGPEYGSKLFVGINGTSGRPVCSTNGNFSFVIDSSAPNAKVWVAMLQVAYATGRPVHVEGWNTCSLYSDTEDVRYLWLQ